MKHYLTTAVALLMAFCAMAQHNGVIIEDFEICPDSTMTMPVILINNVPTRGLQFNMTLPAGLVLVDKELTEYSSDQYGMTMFSRHNNGVWVLGMYPSGVICYPPDSVAIMTVTFKAAPDFTGGEIILWRQLGSTIDNKGIVFDNDTTIVTVPKASVMESTEDGQPVKEQYFNLMGQPIASPDSVSVAVQVTTRPDGRRTSRKVAVSR